MAGHYSFEPEFMGATNLSCLHFFYMWYTGAFSQILTFPIFSKFEAFTRRQSVVTCYAVVLLLGQLRDLSLDPIPPLGVLSPLSVVRAP